MSWDRVREHYANPEQVGAPALGCGNPLTLVDLQPGDDVVDLGSGNGLEVIAAARRVWPFGRAWGIDGTSQMVARARDEAGAAGVANAEFRVGRIEELPLSDQRVDVALSNCVMVLIGDKPAALGEAFRVLRPGGRLAIYDLVRVDRSVRPSDRLCGDALTADGYHRHLAEAGFVDVSVTPDHEVEPGVWSAFVRAARPGAPRPQVRRAAAADRPAVYAVIEAAGLEPLGVDPATTWVAVDGDQVVGTASLEVRGTTALLRSVAVEPANRRRGVGRRVVAAAVREGAARGAVGLWTATATRWFTGLGFVPADAGDVPAMAGCSPEKAQALIWRGKAPMA